MNLRIKSGYIAALSAALLPCSAYGLDVGAAAQIGSKGVGIHLYTPLNSSLILRFGPSYHNQTFTSTTSYTEYDAHLRLRTIDVLLDWHPLSNGFRLTGGVVVNNSRIRLDARPDLSGSITIGNRAYSASDIGTVEGEIYFRRYAPYLGFGWGQAGADLRPGWHFQGDVGVMFLGRPRAWLQSTGCDLGSSMLGTAACNELRRAVPAETYRLEEEIKDYRSYPVLRLGIAYRF